MTAAVVTPLLEEAVVLGGNGEVEERGITVSHEIVCVKEYGNIPNYALYPSSNSNFSDGMVAGT